MNRIQQLSREIDTSETKVSLKQLDTPSSKWNLWRPLLKQWRKGPTDHPALDSLSEELDAFAQQREEKSRFLPDYVPVALLTSLAEARGLVVHPTTGGSLVTLRQAPLHSGLDIGVNVPELATKGREHFIHALRLKRMDSAGGLRRNMLWEVAQTNQHVQRVWDGTGGVYAMQGRNGDKLAMFKPTAEEKFVREGLRPGEGAVREEAAYILDHGGFAGVPPTAVAKLQMQEGEQQGAVQRYMCSMGSLEDFALPSTLEASKKVLAVREVHKIGLLDIRLFNTDRHLGNILLLGEAPPYQLVPIDHGCILPSWFQLAEARFDWHGLPQSHAPFSYETLQYIAKLNVEEDAVKLRGLGIREECIATMRVGTMVLKIAAARGKSLHWIGSFMQRSGCLQDPSPLEAMILEACTREHIPFHFTTNEWGEQTGAIAPGILSRRPPNRFFETLKTLLHQVCTK